MIQITEAQDFSRSSPNSKLSDTRDTLSLTDSRNNSLSIPSDDQSNAGFNFQSSTLAKAPVNSKSTVGQRRGHKYKHSSVSHQFFLEPPPRPTLLIPNSLPVPTFKECRKSMSQSQRRRIYWSLCHMVVAAYTLWCSDTSLALTALSHLILFDSLGAMLCASVDILGNFEVWKRSSIRHPFGLERAEVLAGFAMSVLLLFMGLDLISHNLQHILEGYHVSAENQPPQHTHTAPTSRSLRVAAAALNPAALLAIAATLISALGLKNHERIGKTMHLAYMDSLPLPRVLANPSHFLTLSCSVATLLLPLLNPEAYFWVDHLLSASMAIAMCALGFHLVKTLGFMLLMSYGGSAENLGGVSEIISQIEADTTVTAVKDARFWQVHYGLCIAVIKLSVRGNDETLVKLRDRVQSLIRGRLGGGYGAGGRCRWEVSLQMDTEIA